MKNSFKMLGIVLGLAALGFADSDHQHMAAMKGSKEFEQMKLLAGRWKGTTMMGPDHKEPQEAIVDYKVTAGGAAVVETLFPGTPHEMVSVYYDEGGKLRMTHYCMLGNRPILQLAKAEGNEFDLELAPNSGIKPAEQHMDSLHLVFTDPNHLVHRWGCMDDHGKVGPPTVITLTRVQ